MAAEQQRVYTATERAELLASARAWKGTQAEFAARHGISQGTVSKWLGAAGRREYTDAERAEAVAGLRSWAGTQTAFANAQGIPQATLSRWVNDDRQAHRAQGPRPAEPRDAPTMLEVVPVPAAGVRMQAAAPVRLLLGDAVALVFDTLPPASWIAELAAELRRC